MATVTDSGPKFGSTQCSWCWARMDYAFDSLLAFSSTMSYLDYYIICPDCRHKVTINNCDIPRKWRHEALEKLERSKPECPCD